MKPSLKIEIFPLDENQDRNVRVKAHKSDNQIENFAVV